MYLRFSLIEGFPERERFSYIHEGGTGEEFWLCSSTEDEYGDNKANEDQDPTDHNARLHCCGDVEVLVGGLKSHGDELEFNQVEGTSSTPLAA